MMGRVASYRSIILAGVRGAQHVVEQPGALACLSQRTAYEQFVEGEGIAFEQLDILNIKERALVKVGLGTFGVFNGATHPNAPSVYLNCGLERRPLTFRKATVMRVGGLTFRVIIYPQFRCRGRESSIKTFTRIHWSSTSPKGSRS